jgi:hypothetical protein
MKIPIRMSKLTRLPIRKYVKRSSGKSSLTSGGQSSEGITLPPDFLDQVTSLVDRIAVAAGTAPKHTPPSPASGGHTLDSHSIPLWRCLGLYKPSTSLLLYFISAHFMNHTFQSLQIQMNFKKMYTFSYLLVMKPDDVVLSDSMTYVKKCQAQFLFSLG